MTRYKRCPTCGRLSVTEPQISRRLREYLDFIRAYFWSHGEGPSYEEIAGAVGVSSLATVWEAVARLEAMGLLVLYREPTGAGRAIQEVVDD